MYRKNKKAAGEAISALILFIAVLIITTGVIITFKNYVSDTQGSFKTQSNIMNNKLKTFITISNIFYNSSSNKTFIYVKNIGETKLRPKNFDLYIDNEFLTNFSYVYADNLSKQADLFSPQETIVLIKVKYLASGTHDVLVVTEYSSSAKDSFNN